MQDYEITQGVDSSPAQRLMERRNRTLLPTVQSLLEPRNPVKPHESEQLPFNQLKQARYYNHSARDLPVLKAGDTVQMKPFVLGLKSWEKACVTKRLDKRSWSRLLNLLSSGIPLNEPRQMQTVEVTIQPTSKLKLQLCRSVQARIICRPVQRNTIL